MKHRPLRRVLVAFALSALGAALSLHDVSTSARQSPGPSEPTLTGDGRSTTELSDGRVLTIAADDRGAAGDRLTIFDPATGQSRALAMRLGESRRWHSATVLPDGTVLILGGRTNGGAPATTAERFDPATETVSVLSLPAAQRAGQTATVLTDERVLVAGGVDVRNQPVAAELLDLTSGVVISVQGGSPRRMHMADLQADGTVLLSGGDESGSNDVFDPSTGVITRQEAPRRQAADSAPLVVAAADPPAGASDVRLDAHIVLRLSNRVRVGTFNDRSVSLSGHDGAVPLRVVPIEGGRLVFIYPGAPLKPDEPYTLAVTGVSDAEGRLLRMLPLRFRTMKASDSSPTDEEPWYPDATDRGGWRSNRPPSPWESSPPLTAPPGVTAISGRVLTLDGRPLAGVTLEIEGDAKTETDRTGRFLLMLERSDSGRRVLEIEGASANRGGRRYGFFEYGIPSMVRGQTNVLPFTIWMPRLDTKNEIVVPSPTVADTVVTTPYIPGLELHLPAGTIIRGEDGRPVTRIGITPIPVDRPPFPLARNVDVPVYFTIQPGGAYVQTSGSPTGAQLIYPNYHGASPGQLAQFFHYDPNEKDWYVYGIGRISADGKRGMPDARTRLYAFTGAMFSTGMSPAPTAPPPGGCRSDGDPVDLATGILVEEHTDLVVSDVIPLSLTRTYRPGDSVVRAFGIGTSFSYGIFAWSARQYQEADLILPDSGRIHYVRTSPGTGWTDAVFEAQSTPTAYFKSVITWNGNGWNLRLRDGTVYVFGENAPLQAIRDRFGNEVRILRTNGQVGNISRITSPNGRWISFEYDQTNRVTRATDNAARSVSYEYDASGMLSKVTSADGAVTTYTYDQARRLTTTTTPRQFNYVNQYDTSGRVQRQTLPGGGTYEFSYTVTPAGLVSQTDVTDPRGTIRRTSFNTDRFCLSDIRAVGLPEQQTTTWSREPVSNRVLSTTDALNRVTAFTYDTFGNRLTMTRLSGTPDAVRTTYTYDQTYSQLTSLTDPLGHVQQFTVDLQGRTTGIGDALDHVSTFVYRDDGQPSEARDPLDNATTYSYSSGDLVAITDPMGRVNTLAVDAVGRITSRADPTGAAYQVEYDAMDRVVKSTDPLGSPTSLQYDSSGNVAQITDALSHTVTYSYSNRDFQVGRTDALSRVETAEYDRMGNMVSVTDRKGQVTDFVYDALHRRTFIGFGKNGNAYANTIGYAYDAGNRLTSVVDSLSGTITRSFDLFDRLVSETSELGTVTYAYDADGRRTEMTIDGQPTVFYSYDVADRLIAVTRGASTIEFAYDEANRRTGLSLPNGLTVGYEFDAASFLTRIAYYMSGQPLGDLTFTYDARGNRTSVGGSWARVTLPQPVSEALYDAENQLTLWAGRGLSSDANGAVTFDGANVWSWDARNQLAGVTGVAEASYAYDGLGRRVGRNVGGNITSFLYDGLDVAQARSAGQSVSFVRGTVVDEWLLQQDAAGTSVYLNDGLPSPLAVVHESGALTEHTFEPFGADAVSGASLPIGFQFAGREADAAGVSYYRARYYSPTLDRFASEDPLQESLRIKNALSAKDDWNAFTYARNNPTRWTDPYGLSTWTNPFGAWNGNLWGDFRPQRPGCSMGPLQAWADSHNCLRECCEAHDRCYERFNCNKTSWLISDLVGPCQLCNQMVKDCFVMNLPLPKNAPSCLCAK